MKKKKISYLLILSSIFNLVSCNKEEKEKETFVTEESSNSSYNLCDFNTCVSDFYPIKREEYKITNTFHVLDTDEKFRYRNYSYKTSGKDYSNSEEYTLLYSNLFDLIDFFLSQDLLINESYGERDYFYFTTKYSFYPTVSDGNYRRPFYFGFMLGSIVFNLSPGTFIKRGEKAFLFPSIFSEDLTEEQIEKVKTVKRLTESLLNDEPTKEVYEAPL